jgi:hypothetical protein
MKTYDGMKTSPPPAPTIPAQDRGSRTLVLCVMFAAILPLAFMGCVSRASQIAATTMPAATAPRLAWAPANEPSREVGLLDLSAPQQDTGDVAAASAPPQADTKKKDNSGTNPANFTYEFRLSTEMAELTSRSGGGSRDIRTFELRVPLGRDLANLTGGSESRFNQMGQTWQLRGRARTENLSVDNPGAFPFESSEVSGIGDMDARVLNIPYSSKGVVIAAGLEGYFDTASNDALGAGTTSLAPQVFAVFPNLLGPGSLFAPGYQYVFDVAGDGPDVSRSQIDLYFVWMLAKGKNWLLVDPQILIDHKNSIETGTFEVEWGYMVVPKSGISIYVRPGVGIGAYRPYSWNLEFGLKFVWR